MLPAGVKTEVWRELMESLASKLKAPIVCEHAVFGSLSFFQELRNRKSDSPYASVPGVRYVSVSIDGSSIHVGPFSTNEPHAFDEELADARQKLPAWKDYYAELIELCVNQAAVAGRSAHIVGDSLNRAKLLLEFSQSVGHVQNVDNALYTGVQFLVHKFKLNNVFISAYGKNARQFDLSEPAKAVEQRVIAHVKANKSTCTIQNVQSDFLLDGIKDRETLPKCIVGFPLISNRELVGYVVLSSEILPSIEGISEVLYEFAAELSRLSQYEKVQASAVTDALTGLSNRANFTKKFDLLLSQLSSKGAPISVFMLDVDNFKKFNDTKGHPEGDLVLRSIAEVIRSVAPKDSMCCRYGGEEFVIILPDLSQQPAKELAEKLRSEIEQNCPLTVSIGVMTCMNSSASRELLIREADRAMYRAKNLGKNKVIAFFMVDKNLGVIDV